MKKLKRKLQRITQKVNSMFNLRILGSSTADSDPSQPEKASATQKTENSSYSGFFGSFFSAPLSLFSSGSNPPSTSKVDKAQNSSTTSTTKGSDLYYDDKLGRYVVRGVIYDEHDKPTKIEDLRVKKEKEFLPPPKSNGSAANLTTEKTINKESQSITSSNIPQPRMVIKPQVQSHTHSKNKNEDNGKVKYLKNIAQLSTNTEQKNEVKEDDHTSKKVISDPFSKPISAPKIHEVTKKPMTITKKYVSPFDS